MTQSFEVNIHQVKIVGVYMDMETPTRLCAIHFLFESLMLPLS